MGNSEKESLENRIEREIIIRREAQLEVQEAFQYYQEKSEGLGFEFMRSLDAALQSVKRNPFAYQKIYGETRRILLRKFLMRFSISPKKAASSLLPVLIKSEVKLTGCDGHKFFITVKNLGGDR